jgi:mRNA interferase RelE/StbE
MSWRLEVSRRARRELMALPADVRRAIGLALERLAIDPSGADLKKLSDGSWRLRVGQWRVILDLDNQTGLMSVQRVVNRRDAYR